MKYRFEVTYANKMMLQVSKFINSFDIGTDSLTQKSVLNFSTKKEIPVPKLKEIIVNGYESADCKVFMILGGKVE